jgi:hypothetical protein
MFDDIHAYLVENVIPTFKEFNDALFEETIGMSKNLKLAINSASVLFHLREHMPEQYKKPRNQIESICPEYGLIGDIANASKHKTLTLHNPQIVNSCDIYELFITTDYEDELGKYYGNNVIIEAKLVNGSTVDVGDLLCTVLNFWCKEFCNLGIIKQTPIFKYKTVNHPLTRKEVESKKIVCQQYNSVRFSQCRKVQKFDYSINKVVPIDLTGMNIEMDIYTPPKKVMNIDFINKKTGLKISRELEINEKAFTEYSKLISTEEQEKFKMQLAQKSGLLLQLAMQASKMEEE